MKKLISINTILFSFGVSIFLSIVFIDNETNSAMILGFVLTGFTGLLILIRNYIYMSSRFDFVSILAASTLMSVGIGTALTYLSFDSMDMWISYVHGLGISNNSVVVQSNLAVLFYSLCLFMIEVLLTKKSSEEYVVNQIENKNIQLLKDVSESMRSSSIRSNILRFSFFVSNYQAYMLASGQIGFLNKGWTTGFGSEQIIDPKVQLLKALVPFIIFVLGLFASNLRSLKKVNQFSYIFIGLVQFIWLVTIAGRSQFLFGLIIFIFGFRLSTLDRYKPEKNFQRADLYKTKKTPKKRFIITIISVCLVVIIGVQITSFSRYISNLNTSFASYSFLERIEYTAKEMSAYYLGGQSEFRAGEFEKKLNENLSTRTFVLSGFAFMLDHLSSNQTKALLGQDMISSFAKAIPGALFPSKYLFLSQESLYSSVLNIPLNVIKDIADSFFLSAYLDFSWAGFIIYPLVLSFMIKSTVSIALKFKSKVISTLVVASLLSLCLSGGESAMTSFFVTLRDLIILSILIWSISTIFPNRFKESYGA